MKDDELIAEIAEIINSGHIAGYDISNGHTMNIVEAVRKYDKRIFMRNLWGNHSPPIVESMDYTPLESKADLKLLFALETDDGAMSLAKKIAKAKHNEIVPLNADELRTLISDQRFIVKTF